MMIGKNISKSKVIGGSGELFMSDREKSCYAELHEEFYTELHREILGFTQPVAIVWKTVIKRFSTQKLLGLFACLARTTEKIKRMNLLESNLTSKVIGCAIEVHRALGPGLLESAYRECLFYELQLNGLKVEREKPMPIIYKEVKLNHGYRMDLLVENKLVIETKTVEIFTDVHFEQVLTYLRLGKYPLGLLINFHVTLLKHGIQRVINTV